MAVTITPEDVGRQGSILTLITGQDPTYIEAPEANIPIAIFVNNPSGSTQAFSIETFPQDFDQASEEMNTMNPSLPSSAVFFLSVLLEASKHIVDNSVDPPRLQLTGADLVNLEIAAFYNSFL